MGIVKIPMFIVGVLMGYLSFNNKSCNVIGLVVILVLIIMLYLFKQSIPDLSCYSEQLIRICFIIGISCALSIIMGGNIVAQCKINVEWFDKYSL